jgi:hypothetical protein
MEETEIEYGNLIWKYLLKILFCTFRRLEDKEEIEEIDYEDVNIIELPSYGNCVWGDGLSGSVITEPAFQPISSLLVK